VECRLIAQQCTVRNAIADNSTMALRWSIAMHRVTYARVPEEILTVRYCRGTGVVAEGQRRRYKLRWAANRSQRCYAAA
jgi:hypothetical protein